MRFIRTCPEMRLESHTSLDQGALLAILEPCPKIDQWTRSKVCLVTPLRRKTVDMSWKEAACDANPSLGVKLRDLTLRDQSMYEKGVKKLQKARLVRSGDTLRQHAYSRNAEYYAYRGGKMVFGAVETSKYPWW